ncbi:MAG: type IV pilus modification PilV family protein [Candidatus Levyibacteriota bacterium]
MRSKKGQTLIEVLIGLATMVVVISAITIAVISSLNNASYAKNQNLATQYAQQGMELMRDLRDINYASFSALTNTTYCLAKGCSMLSNTSGDCGPKVNAICDQNVDIFVREVDVVQNSAECLGGSSAKVTVSVSWADGKCTDRTNLFCHQVKLDSCLSNNNVINTP